MEKFDLVIIGGGPGGYVAALHASKAGLRVACVEKEDRLGGTCLRVGCIPSKALLESSERFVDARDHLQDHGVLAGDVAFDLERMHARKRDVVASLASGIDAMFRQGKVQRFLGHGRLVSANSVEVEGEDGSTTKLEATNILIATGSLPVVLPGVEVDGDKIGGSTEALDYPEVPGTLVVIGAGYIGLELGSVWRRLGSKVIVLEYLERILPGMDSELARQAQRVFEKQGLEFRLGTKVTSARREGDGCVVECEGADPISCDRVLLAVGRKPNTDGLGLDAAGLATDERGRIPVDEAFRTKVANVYAIGDVTPGPMLAHKAEAEAAAVIDQIVNGYGRVDHDTIPGVAYTHPEIASVGKTEDQLKEAGTPYRKGVFHYRANGRARVLGETDGLVKVLAHKETDRLLGVHILGARAGDLIAEATAALTFGASAEDLFLVSHAHPTLSEVLKEAAHAAHG